MGQDQDADGIDGAIATARGALGERRPMRTEPLARWEGARPVEALDPRFAPLNWIVSRARCVDRARSLPPYPEEGVFGWRAAAWAVGVSVSQLRRLLLLRPDDFVVERPTGGIIVTSLRECREAQLALVVRGVLRGACPGCHHRIY